MSTEDLRKSAIPTVLQDDNPFFMKDENLRTQTSVSEDSKQCA